MLEHRIKDTKLHAVCYAVCVFLFAIGHTKIQYLSYFTDIMVKYGKFVPIAISLLFLMKRLRFGIRSIVIMCMFGLLLILNFFSHDMSYTIFFIAYFMIACSKTNPTQIYKYYAICVFVVIGLTLTLTSLGILVNDNSWYGRYDLGFTYCTFGPNLFLSASVALVCWKREKVGWGWWCFVLLMNQYFFWKTNTDAVYLCVTVLFVGVILTKNSRFKVFLEKNKLCRFVFSHSAVICAILTIALQLYYNAHSTSVAMVWLNSRLSTRLSMGLNVFERYSTGLGLLSELLVGMKTELATYLDSSYLSILTQLGAPLLVFFCAFMDLIGRKAYESKDYNVAICVLVFMVHCITDPQLSSFRCNPLIITALFYYGKKSLDNMYQKKIGA